MAKTQKIFKKSKRISLVLLTGFAKPSPYLYYQYESKLKIFLTTF